MVNHRQIAEAAGVSRGTVSLALRNDPRISAETRDRVRKVAAELGYRENPMVSALMSQVAAGRAVQAAGALAMLWLGREKEEHSRNQFAHAKHVAGAQAQAAEIGYRLEPFCPHVDGIGLDRLRAILRTRGIRGVFIVPPPYPARLNDFDFDGLAGTTIGFALQAPVFNRVSLLYMEAAHLAVTQVHRHGYHRPAVILNQATLGRVADLWLGGFLLERERARDAHTLPLLTLPASLFEAPECIRAIEAFVSQHQPDCLLVDDWNGAIQRGIGESSACRRLGFVDLARNHPLPETAGIDQRPQDLGRWAIKALVSQIQRNESGVPEDPLEFGLHCHWHDGASLPPRA